MTKRSYRQLGTASSYLPWTAEQRPNFIPERFDRCGDLAGCTFTSLPYKQYLDNISSTASSVRSGVSSQLSANSGCCAVTVLGEKTRPCMLSS